VAGTALLEWPAFGAALPQAVAARLASLFHNPATNQVPLSQRLAARRVWGRLGYPGVTTLPPVLTPVLEGEFLYGESKAHRTVAPFRAGLYPVTNAQFAQFMEAGGYEQAAWWSQEGWQQRRQAGWNRPRYWEDSPYNDSNQPVVGVSWYEAEAFCKWLSGICGQPYRLPMEEEWERLARGQDGRKYPWGDDWQKEWANTREAGIGRPSPVGLFPAGVSPAGVYDCAGNVWEWCADWSDESQQFRVVRGGAFLDDRSGARCAYRLRSDPSSRFNSIGFRLVVSPIL
jgi:formylglycine-generating enzyme required for sulfatase activity